MQRDQVLVFITHLLVGAVGIHIAGVSVERHYDGLYLLAGHIRCERKIVSVVAVGVGTSVLPRVGGERWSAVRGSDIFAIDLESHPRAFRAVYAVDGHAEVGAMAGQAVGRNREFTSPGMVSLTGAAAVGAEQIGGAPAGAVDGCPVLVSLHFREP